MTKNFEMVTKELEETKKKLNATEEKLKISKVIQAKLSSERASLGIHGSIFFACPAPFVKGSNKY